jgi:hypothetical protein
LPQLPTGVSFFATSSFLNSWGGHKIKIKDEGEKA